MKVCPEAHMVSIVWSVACTEHENQYSSVYTSCSEHSRSFAEFFM